MHASASGGSVKPDTSASDVVTAVQRPVPQQVIAEREPGDEDQGPVGHEQTLRGWVDGPDAIIAGTAHTREACRAPGRAAGNMGTDLAGEVLWLHRSLPSF